jgi:hypothetical protein
VSGQCLSPSEGGRALTPPTHLSLGEPLPHQLANRTRAHLPAESHLWSEDIIQYYLQFPAAILAQEADNPRVTLPFAANHCWSARLACLIHAANVHSEPGSNPSINCFIRPAYAARDSIKNGLKHMASSFFSLPLQSPATTPKDHRRFSPQQPVSVTFLCWLKFAKKLQRRSTKLSKISPTSGASLACCPRRETSHSTQIRPFVNTVGGIFRRAGNCPPFAPHTTPIGRRNQLRSNGLR